MLPQQYRLTDSSGFTSATRGGRRAGGRLLVLHLGPGEPGTPARIGFVVSRAVGGAVVRNLVKRRLRHLVRERLATIPSGVVVAVRALPAAAAADSGELARELDRCLSRVLPTDQESVKV